MSELKKTKQNRPRATLGHSMPCQRTFQIYSLAKNDVKESFLLDCRTRPRDNVFAFRVSFSRKVMVHEQLKICICYY